MKEILQGLAILLVGGMILCGAIYASQNYGAPVEVARSYLLHTTNDNLVGGRILEVWLDPLSAYSEDTSHGDGSASFEVALVNAGPTKHALIDMRLEGGQWRFASIVIAQH